MSGPDLVQETEEATWESKETMRQQYPQLFDSGNFEDEILLRGGEL